VYPLLRKLLFSLPAETSHRFSLKALSLAEKTGLLSHLVSEVPEKPVTVMGIKFNNPVGLAAGLDKNGEYLDALAILGFGFVEIGTVTPRAQPGNPHPRLFRLAKHKAIINRMGFNNQGVDYLLEQVRQAKYDGVLGINIGKNFDTPVENAIDDYLIGLEKVYTSASYITVNISSPNTPGLRTLQYGDELDELLSAIKSRQEELADEHGKYIPVAIKVAPDLSADEIQEISEILLKNKIDCLIATNTTLDRGAVSESPYVGEKGGLSGAPLTQMSTAVIRDFYQHLRTDIPIIGVGGIMKGADAEAKIRAGAVLVQLYSGLIYQGADLIGQSVKAIEVSGLIKP
jgi:dihydroorotate dehydrogenase